MDARRKLLTFLELQAFQPVLRADTRAFPSNQRDALRAMQDRTRSQIERFRSYRSAEEIVMQVRRDQTSVAAERTHQALRHLGLPSLHDIHDDFERLTQELSIK